MGTTFTGRGQKPLRLHFKSEQRVLVVTEDEDRFMTTSREAAIACRRAQDEQEWRDEFQAFLGHIHEWCKEHADVIDRAYVGFGDEGLKVFLVTKGKDYCSDLDNAAADLDIDLGHRFPGCPAYVMHLPNRPLEALQSFFSPPKAMQLYGN